MNILPCQTMRDAEQALFASGAMSSAALMRTAIDAAADILTRDPEFARAASRFECAIVYAGKGNNAGDAIGLAYRLGFRRITLRCAVPPEEMSQDTRSVLEEGAADAEAVLATAPPCLPPDAAALIIDGLLGSGARGPLRPGYAALVEEMNSLRAERPRCALLAVDIPSGLHADEGALYAPVVQADATLAIGCVKPGMVADGAEDYVGRLLCVPLPQVPLPATREQALDAAVLSLLPRRPFSFFKNRAGRVRIIAGAPGYAGAAHMCAAAAVSAGAGLVELYCPRSIYPVLAARVPAEVMVRPTDSFDEVPTEGADALLIGPGLGKLSEAEALPLRRLAEQPPCPLVLDADGLNAAAAGAWQVSPRCILTPHPGEMRRLFPGSAGLSRAQAAAAFVAQRPCTLLLKGARSIITDGSLTYYNTSGGPHMANGGQGDVLSGVIAAYAAMGLAPLHAAALGAYLCGRAADTARARAGFPPSVSATRLLRYLAVL